MTESGRCTLSALTLPLLAGAACFFTLVACGGETPGGAGAAGIAARDSAGIEILEYEDFEGALEESVLVVPPEFEVGSRGDVAEEQFTDILAVRALPGDQVAVVMRFEARIFGSDGTHLRTLGGEGAGPGEFGQFDDLHPLGDTVLLALDPTRRRFTYFDQRTGALVLTRPFDQPPGFLRTAGHLEDGRYVVHQSAATEEAELGMPADYVVVVDPVRASIDTVAPFSGTPFGDEPAWGESSWPAFSPYPRVAAGGNRIWAGWSGRFELLRLDPDRGLTQILRSSHRGDAITEEMKETQRPRIVEMPDLGVTEMPPVFGRYLPVFRRLLVSDDGGVAIERYPSPIDGTFALEYIDGGGRPRWSVPLPAGAWIHAVGDDWLLGTFLGEFDVPIVRRYRVALGPG